MGQSSSKKGMICSSVSSEEGQITLTRAHRSISPVSKRRFAAGSGTEVQDVNRVLKQYREMSKMMKKVSKMGKKGLARSGLPGMPPGGMPPGMGPFGR